MDPAAELALRLLDSVGTRIDLAEVLDLLRVDAIARRFELDDEQLTEVRDLLVRSGARWGFDAEDRAAHGQPALREHTLEFGLDRLLLGAALPAAAADGVQPVAGVAPDPEVEGQQAALVGRVAGFLRTLQRGLERLSAPRDLPAWRRDLLAVLETLAGSRPHESGGTNARRSVAALDTEILSAELDQLIRAASGAGFDAVLPLDALRSVVRSAFDARDSERGFLDGGVTFCAMLPLRSVPFRAIALVGLGDGVFPRAAPHGDLDLLLSAPRDGDRDARKDDRYLFLEALLAAREKLAITYVGRDQQTDGEVPPSVVLQELLDVIEARFDPPADRSGAFDSERERRDQVRSAIVVQHPLQAFSRRYFSGVDPRLFSYDAAALHGARTLVERGSSRVALRDVRRPAAGLARSGGGGGRNRRRAVDAFVRFWRQPTEALLAERAGVRFADDAADVPVREPIEIDALERYQLGQAWLELRLAGCSDGEALVALTARGLLPPGRLAEQKWDEVRAHLEAMLPWIDRWPDGPPREPAPFALELADGSAGEGLRLVGRVDWLRDTPAGLVQRDARYVSAKAKHLLPAWLRHMVATALGLPVTTFWLGRDAAPIVLPPDLVGRDAAQGYLRELGRLYRVGMRAPLPFSPEASLVAAEDAKRARTAWKRELEFASVLERVYGDDVPPFHATPGLAELAFDEVARAVFPPFATARLQPVRGSSGGRS